jgi:cytochrome c oxidase subunit 4
LTARPTTLLQTSVALLVLLVLTVISFVAAEIELGAAAPVVALAIASVKAAVVFWFFMHVRESRTSERTIVAILISFIALICLGVAADVAFR